MYKEEIEIERVEWVLNYYIDLLNENRLDSATIHSVLVAAQKMANERLKKEKSC